jgi:transcriptional regulator with XRE-family HTH domain
LDRIDLTRWLTMSDGSERNRQRLGLLVVARRKELGLSIREAARRAGVMRPTWTGLEEGSRRTADYNFAAMERTLRWSTGSIEAVLAGGEPAVSDSEDIPGPVRETSAVTDRQDTQGRDTPGRAPRGQGARGEGARGEGARGEGLQGAGGEDAAGRPGERSVVAWSDIVRVLDGQLGAIGQSAGAAVMQRLWGAEQITSLARRFRSRQIKLSQEPTGRERSEPGASARDAPGRGTPGQATAVAWSDVVAALEATIAAIHQDSGISSEIRLWGVEIIVDVAAELKVVRQSLEVTGEDS